jgi:hypothetical protein
MNREGHVVACWLRRAAVAACCVIGLVLASCGAASSSTPESVQAGDAQNGRSVTLHQGQTLVVTLASTYWSFQGSSNPKVLALVGTPVATPGSCSPPGSGCGTVSQTFRAVGAGTAQVTASRVSCGEALRCTGSAGHYQLTVQVTAAGG